ncbi:MAG TPA: thiamine pyrophosphate-dependent enzyme [Candidatus Tectomicrobia bacterium]|nr:thiamine pyrophosphate-dependent enzyme [Candidatus Tectomicrobia bacterium]
MPSITGRHAFLEVLHQEGVEYIFGNPGTTELPLIDALVDRPDIKYILALQEAAAVGMADGYAQASGQVGVLNLHVSPGLGNALGVLYDSWRMKTPLLVTAGQQDQRMQLSEPVLWSELIPLMRMYAKWTWEPRTIKDLVTATRRALKVAMTPPTGMVFLSLPMDVLYGEGEAELWTTPSTPTRLRADRAALDQAATLLLRAKNPIVVVGDDVGASDALAEAATVAELLGARVFTDTFPGRTDFPSDHPLYQGILVRSQPAVRAILEQADLMFALGAEVFPFSLPSEVEPVPANLTIVHMHSDPWEVSKNYPARVGIIGDLKASLPELAQIMREKQTLGQREEARQRAESAAQAKQTASESLKSLAAEVSNRLPIPAAVLMQTIADTVPAETIIVDESITSGATLRDFLIRRTADSFYGMRGGGLGWGLPATIGVKLAKPGRPVLGIIGDGSTLYVNQALWTAARYRIPVVWLICNNAQYMILKRRLHAYGGAAAKAETYIGLDLMDPEVDFLALARAMGVHGVRADTADTIAKALREAISRQGPTLIDVPIERSIKPAL